MATTRTRSGGGLAHRGHRVASTVETQLAITVLAKTTGGAWPVTRRLDELLVS